MKTVHFIGIGGTGISAIALMLLERGLRVSGSDIVASNYFNMVTKRGAKTVLGHDPDLACMADLVVRSSAVKDDDPEVLAAQKAGIPVVKRLEFLPELTRGKQTLAIAGSHGKTTTTAMLVCLLDRLATDPSFILGAEIKSLCTNAREGSGVYFVIEADEYDYMFLGLDPLISVVTNIEHDHPDCFPSPEDYLNAFASFLRRTSPFGCALVSADDQNTDKLLLKLGETSFPVLTFGFSESAHYQIKDLKWDNGYSFSLVFSPQTAAPTELGEFKLALPGRHNVSNAAAAFAIVHQLGLDLSQLSNALAEFSGTERRFETVYDQNGIVIINDYGHHPTQITATLQAARQIYPMKLIWAIWEPHTYSRTEKLHAEFECVLSTADRVVIAPIYAAREQDTGFSPQIIAESIPGNKAFYFNNFQDLENHILSNLGNNDVIIMLSAGKGPKISENLIHALRTNLDKQSLSEEVK